MNLAIEESENSICEIIALSETTKEDWNTVCHFLGGILTEYFSRQERETSLRSWTVDDMYADKVELFSKEVTLNGPIHWLGGGSECVYYQVDIACNTVPLLYSYKLQNNRWKQVMYIGKTFNGWMAYSH